jgi:hypothetical protein
MALTTLPCATALACDLRRHRPTYGHYALTTGIIRTTVYIWGSTGYEIVHCVAAISVANYIFGHIREVAA